MPTTYTGRCGTIVTETWRLLNDASGSYTKEADILAWMNLLTYELAEEGYWQGYASINTTANTGTYDISAATFSGLTNYTFVALDKLYWIYNGAREREIEVCSRERIEEALQVTPTGETVRGYFVAGTILNWVPVPTGSLTAAMRAWCYVCPPALTGGTPTDNPVTPKAFDLYFVYGCCEKAAIKDRTSVTRDSDIMLFRAQKEEWKQKLLLAGGPTKVIMRNYR